MLKSLSTKEYYQGDVNILQMFDLVIFDECHHLGANTFSRILKKTNPMYILGLSATFRRKDGLQKIFYDFIGQIIYEKKEQKNTTVDVIIH